MGRELGEADIYSAFGLKAPEQPNEQPAETPQETAEKPETAKTPQETAEQTETPAEQPKEEQSAEERRANAARRREAETAEKIKAAEEKARQEERDAAESRLKEFFKAAKLTNPVTGNPIESTEEFAKWQADQARQKAERDLKAGRLTEETLSQIIADNPIIQKADAIIQKAEADEARRKETEEAAQKEVFQKQVEAEIAEIGKMEPGVKTLEDVLKIPEAEEFRAKVKDGYTFLDAYKLATEDRRAQKKAEAAKAQTIRNEQSKNHLQGFNAQGAGAEEVPRDVVKQYRIFNPNATMDEIQKHYNKYKAKK